MANSDFVCGICGSTYDLRKQEACPTCIANLERGIDHIPAAIQRGPSEDMDAIKDAIRIADKYGMRLEMLHSALKFMKEDPSQDIQEVLYGALVDWDLFPSGEDYVPNEEV